MTRSLLPILLSSLVTGCSMPQSISVLGSFFPDWMFCAIAGLFMTSITRSLLIRCGQERTLAPAALALPMLMLLFSLLVWLIFF